MPDQTTKQVSITRDEARGLRVLISGYFDDVAGDQSADDDLTDRLAAFLNKLDKAFS